MIMYSYTLRDMFPDDVSYNILKEKWPSVDQTKLQFFCNWLDEFVFEKYAHSTYFRDVEENLEGAYKHLKRYYLGHIDEMYTLKAWYDNNKESLLKSTIKSTSISKASGTAQDGTTYVDNYPESINKTETENESKTPLDQFNSLLRKYRNYMMIWADNFAKEERLKYEN